MKIKVLIPKNNLYDIGLLLKELKNEKCEYYTGEEHGEFTSFIIYTDSVYIRKHIYRNCYYERLIDDEKQETKNKLEKGTL